MNFSMNEKIRTVNCGGRTVSYILTRKKVKNINLRVKPEGIVSISASERVPIKYIENFIREKSEFIFNALDKFSNRAPEPKLPEDISEFRSGDILKFWGIDHTLEINVSEKRREGVIINGNIMTVNVFSPERAGIALKKFYAEQTRSAFEDMNRRTCLMFRAKGYNVPFAEMQIRKMSSRWGSCHFTKGKIVMNSRLVLYPEICAAYVFVHEYAHFIVPDHSEKFYAVVADIMPDYKICRKILKD